MADSRAAKTNVPQLPFKDKFLDNAGLASYSWINFFRSVFERLMPLGIEQSFDMTAGLTDPSDVIGLKFELMNEASAEIEVLFQRITKDSGAQELVEPAKFFVWSKPRSKTYQISKLTIPGTTSANVVLTVTSSGQVQYKAASMTGIKDIDKITWRVRTLKAKIAKAQGVWV